MRLERDWLDVAKIIRDEKMSEPQRHSLATNIAKKVSSVNQEPRQERQHKTGPPNLVDQVLDFIRRKQAHGVSAQAAEAFAGRAHRIGLGIGRNQIFQSFTRRLHVLEFNLNIGDGQHGLGRTRVIRRHAQQLLKIRH